MNTCAGLLLRFFFFGVRALQKDSQSCGKKELSTFCTMVPSWLVKLKVKSDNVQSSIQFKVQSGKILSSPQPIQSSIQLNSAQFIPSSIQTKPGSVFWFFSDWFLCSCFCFASSQRMGGKLHTHRRSTFPSFPSFPSFFSTASAAPVGCFLPFCTSIAQFVSFLVGGANWRLGQSDHMFFSSIFSAPPRHTVLTPGPGGRPGGHSGLCR